ncbi:sensor histidine kinase [Aureibacter tunicatorum]|uniref:Sensor histidine kinase YesM n=1 Tax=Aureibacter tunicatorum TaxID=866807 RepID=A0AAE3XKW2_9BACT|nr:histidine kinase [Aureibacter tunicatorum]MDR6237869.1 sensor histidine kinase YesM [Aureibacter tunicatorum]BDD02904.1 hypothetical protein AUTU_03870 [Aureibacter tunicatorum]
MNRKKPYLMLGQRLAIVFILQLMLTSFDLSFQDETEITTRRLVFTAFFVPFWLCCWYLVDYINNKIAPLPAKYQIGINFFISFLIALVSSKIYQYGDTHLFHNGHLWIDFKYLNLNLIAGIMMFYMMIYWIGLSIDKEKKIREEQLRVKELEKQYAVSQYMTLRSQLEPHFLFNSLSVLSGLLHSNIDLASEFIVKLSQTLRYTIEQNSQPMVSLEDEIKLAENYFFLLKTRFNESIIMSIDIDEKLAKNTIIAPCTFQILIENAIKHNKFNVNHPLKVEIFAKGDYIILKNNINRKENHNDNIGYGLKNIKIRYKLLTESSLEILDDDHFFIVQIPIISQEEYENFNH